MYYLNKGIEENQQSFIVETADDVDNLPTAVNRGNKDSAIGDAYKTVAYGSMAFCVETGDLYVLTSDDSWTKVGG